MPLIFNHKNLHFIRINFGITYKFKMYVMVFLIFIKGLNHFFHFLNKIINILGFTSNNNLKKGNYISSRS